MRHPRAVGVPTAMAEPDAGARRVRRPIRIRRRDGGALLLSLEQQYVVRQVPEDDPSQLGPWKVSTRVRRKLPLWFVAV